MKSYFEDKEAFLKNLHKEGVDFWEGDRKDWYLENFAHLNDQDPLRELIEEGGYAPNVPILSPAIETRLANIEGIQAQGEDNYAIVPWVEPSVEAKPQVEEVIDRIKIRIEFSKKMNRFRDAMDAWHINAETFPVAFLYGYIHEVKKSVPQQTPVTDAAGLPVVDAAGQPQMKIDFVEKTVYVGPFFDTLQPEQVIYDPHAKTKEKEKCRFIGFRDFIEPDVLLAKYKKDAKGTELTREMLTGAVKDDEASDEMDEESGYDKSKKKKGVEKVLLYFAVLDDETPESSKSLRIRYACFLPSVFSQDGTQLMILEEGWTQYQGENSDVYPFFAITAHQRPGRLEGRSTVDIGKPLQAEINDSVRLRFEALSRAIGLREYVEAGNGIYPEDRLARPFERTIVDRIGGIDVKSPPMPNINDMVQEQQMLHEVALNAMAADAVLPTASLTTEQDETATATNRRESLFNSRLGRTFDNYLEGERQCLEWMFHVIRQLYFEGRQAEFEYRLFGPKGQADFTPEDLLLDVSFKVEPFSAIAKRDIDKIMWRDFMATILPILQKGPGLVNEAELAIIEEYWRAWGKEEKKLQEILKPYKDVNAVKKFLDPLGAATATPQPQFGGNGQTSTEAIPATPRKAVGKAMAA